MTVASSFRPDNADDNSHFFKYHGIWAPGVRAFRQLRFSTKAAIISLAFMVPMLALVGWLLQANYRSIPGQWQWALHSPVPCLFPPHWGILLT